MEASKLITNFSETLSGVTTVRAMAAVPRFVRENEELVEASLRTTYSGQVLMMMIMMLLMMRMMVIIDDETKATESLPFWTIFLMMVMLETFSKIPIINFFLQAASQWLELRLQLLGCAVVAGVAIIAVNKNKKIFKVVPLEMINICGVAIIGIRMG